MTKRINVSLSDQQYELLNNYKGMLGNTDSEILRNILLAWFNEQGLFSKNKKENNTKTECSKCFLSKIRK